MSVQQFGDKPQTIKQEIAELQEMIVSMRDNLVFHRKVVARLGKKSRLFMSKAQKSQLKTSKDTVASFPKSIKQNLKEIAELKKKIKK